MRTRLLLLCICVVSYLYSIAQPVNDPCSGAIPIVSLNGSCTTGQDITGATEDIAPGGCTVGSNLNVWYSFVADGVSAQIAVNNGPGVPEITIVQFPTTPCNASNSVEIACSTGSPLTVDNLLVEGTTYYVMVAFSNNAPGTFDICVNNPNPAPYDDCVDAQSLTNLQGACVTYNNNFPSTDVLIPGCFTGATYNVWFSFVAIGVSLDASLGTGPGIGQLAVIDFTGANCNSTGAQVLGCATGTDNIILDNELVIGQTYYIVVGYQNTNFTGAGVGNFELCVNNPIPAPNDDCTDAFVIPTSVLNDPTTCYTSIGGNALNNDWPSTDVGLLPCWNPGDSYNIWYSFVAQGNDVSIEVDPVFNADAQIALVEFTGAPCDLLGAVSLECANGTILDFNDDLIIGNTYYIAVGFEDNEIGDFCMNVFNPVPPPNDHPCDAIALPTNGSCGNYTTIYANPDGYTLPPSCQQAFSNTVWFTVSMSDPDNVGYEIDLDLDDVNPTTTVSVVMYPLTDCNALGNPEFFYCDEPPTEPIEFGPVDETLTYLIMVATSEPNETDFEICVDEIPPCFMNDICDEATVINGVTSDAPFVCVPGCNLFADPEAFTNDCEIGDFSTVWFQVITDGNAALMNIQVTSEEFSAPTITVFHAVPDCANLQQIGLTQSGLNCVVGSGGEAEAFGTDVGANAIYYIAVSSLNSVGGEFELCVNTISAASVCVTSREIVITGRSSGGPLTGPFFPGETVSVCMNVNAYTASNNGCQWFQGMIPVFGNGWDPSSFDPGTGQPLNATVNGNAMGVAGNGLYGTTIWDWFTDVDYHYDHPFYQLGDFDNNGTLDMCNVLYDPDCPFTGGLMGGCCNPCWGAPLGTTLPGGWFAYGINGSCNIPGPPIRVDWGDGNSCGGPMGPWSFCFDLNVREYPDCLEDPSTMNLALGFFTTADGETGAWTGNASVCALDQPAKLTLPMCCNELDTDEEELDPICSDQIIVYVIDQPGVEYWEWTVDPGSVTGATGGEGGPGSIIINTLVNAGSDVETVEYTFLGFAGGACPVFEHTLLVDVYPKIDVTLDPLVLCATPTTPYTITPTVTGGSGNYEYLWSPGGESSSSIMVANPVNGTQYIVTVNDDVGCFNTASMVISVYSTFPVDILAPITEQCLVDGPITIEATASGGMDPYEFLWLLPGGGEQSGESVTSDITGQYLVEVTDEEGCIGKDSIILTLNESPEVTIEAVNGVLAICEGESTTLSGQATGGESPYIYEWDTPDGPNSGKTIEATEPGNYVITVEDNNGCTNTSEIEILAEEEPMPELGPDILQCPDFSDPVELMVTEQFEDYIWSVGPQANGYQSIEVYNAGTYSVTVTNEAGCTGETQVSIDLYPQPAFNMPDTFEICTGNSITLDADDYGGPWAFTMWSQGGTSNTITINSASSHDVTVTDDNGCTGTDHFEVLESAMLSPDLQADQVICTGETVTITAAPGFSTYTWFPAVGSGNSATVTTPGTYSLTVADQSGCTGTESITINSGDITAAISGPNAICAGVLATLDAGSGYMFYQWSNGFTSQMVDVDDGSYTVTVTSTDGCTAEASITIIETPFIPVITGDDMICQTSETSLLDAGGPHPSYVWSANAGGATSQTVSVSAAGTYSVTVTDVSGCVGTDDFVVGNHPIPFVAITGSPDFCVGGNTQLAATSGYPSYLWSPSGNTETITVNTAGNYTVTVTDANGCTNTSVMLVNPPYQETVEITGSLTFCPGDEATLAVPTGYASVLWSTGETTDTIKVGTEGPVSVTVIDTDGCIATDEDTTDANAVLLPVITGDSAICDAGTAVLNAGPGYDNYDWCCGLGTGSTAIVNTPGTYTVTVSSLSGCVGQDDFVVTGSTSPFANVTSTATACNVQEPGGPTTSVNFNSLVTGGDTGGSWVQVSGPSSVNLANLNNVNFSGLTVGTYTFTYTTNSAVEPCVEKVYDLTLTVTDCACPVVDVGLAPDLCNDLGILDLCSLLVPPTSSGGTWSIVSAPPGSNPAFINGCNLDATSADAGTYTIMYTVSGLPSYCPNSVTTTVQVMKTPVAGSAAPPLTFCKGEAQNVSLASLLVGADPGGFWVESSAIPSTGGAFNPNTGRFDIVAQQAGSYTFEYVIPGIDPCPDDMVTVEVIIEDNPVADAGATATLDCNQPTTTLGGSGSSTGTEFTYQWTTTDGVVSNETSLNAIASSAGTYVLTVLNTQTGCSATDQVVIDQIGDFPTDLSLFVQSPDCEGDPPGNAQVSAVTGGTPPYTYSLNGATPVSSPVFPNLAAGDYIVEVTDAIGCKISDSFTIEEMVVVDLSIVNYVNDTFIFALGDTIKLSYLFSGTSDTPDSVVWKLNDSVICVNCTTLELEAKLAGKITLTAYDVRGCEISKSISFLVVRNRDIYIPNIFSPNDDGLNDKFWVYAKTDLKITLMEVYTRWGELVFRTPTGDLDPNDASQGWDGRFKGETLNPGVYVYRIDIRHGDGLVEILSGDITIVR